MGLHCQKEIGAEVSSTSNITAKRERGGGLRNGKYSMLGTYAGKGCDGHGLDYLARAVSRAGLRCMYVCLCVRIYSVFLL